MAEQTQTPDDLHPLAEALVRQLVKKYQLRWDERRREEATQQLYLAGCQVWSDHGDVGLAEDIKSLRPILTDTIRRLDEGTSLES